MSAMLRLTRVYHAASLLALTLISWVVWRTGETNLPPLLPSARLAVNLLYVNLAASYFFLLRDRAAGRLPRAGWLVFAAIGLGLCAMHPVFSGDLMEYLVRGRILGIYGMSPYAHVPAEFPNDLFYRFSTWKDNPDSYGPLYVLLETVPALVVPGSVFLSVWIEKIILLGFVALGTFFFRRLASSSPDGDRLTVAFALCPLLVVSTLVDGHNDVVMLSFTLGACDFFRKKRYTLAFFFVTLGFLVKYTVLLILPLFVVAAVRERWRSQGRFPWGFILKQKAFNVAVVVLAFAPFWAGKSTFLALIRASGWFYTNTIPYMLHRAFALAGVHLPEALVKYGILAVFAAVYAWLLVRAWKTALADDRTLYRTLCVTYLAFYVTITIPFGFHYLLWGLPWLILSRWPLENLLVTLYSFAGLFSYFKRMNYVLAAAAAVYFAMLGARRFFLERRLA